MADAMDIDSNERRGTKRKADELNVPVAAPGRILVSYPTRPSGQLF